MINDHGSGVNTDALPKRQPAYQVVAVSETTVTIWDGHTRYEWGEMTGTMEINTGPHMYEVGDRVDLVLRKEKKDADASSTRA